MCIIFMTLLLKCYLIIKNRIIVFIVVKDLQHHNAKNFDRERKAGTESATRKGCTTEKGYANGSIDTVWAGYT